MARSTLSILSSGLGEHAPSVQQGCATTPGCLRGIPGHLLQPRHKIILFRHIPCHRASLVIRRPDSSCRRRLVHSQGVCIVLFPFVTRRQRAHEFLNLPLPNRQMYSRHRSPPITDQASQSLLQSVFRSDAFKLPVALILPSASQRATPGIRFRHIT